jgi:hypothetical protein
VAIVPLAGPGLGREPRGHWRVLSSAAAAPAAAAIEFVPELPPPGPDPEAAGLWPDSRCELRVAGGDDPYALVFADGSRLPDPVRLVVRTRGGASAAARFRSARPGGPRLVGVAAAPLDGAGGWRLGRLGDHSELRLTFDQPLDPRPAGEPGIVGAVATEAVWSPQFDALVVDFARAEDRAADDFPDVPAEGATVRCACPRRSPTWGRSATGWPGATWCCAPTCRRCTTATPGRARSTAG